jgi:hypothetical protein
VEFGLPLVGLVGCVVEKEIGVVYAEFILGVGKREGDVCVDGFFLRVKFPEVVDEFGGLSFGFRGRGVELEVGNCGVDGLGCRTLTVVEGESLGAAVELVCVGGWGGDDGWRAGGAGR